MARKRPSPSSLPADVEALNQIVDEDLSLPSLRDRPPPVQGYAYRFFLVLPLLSSEGQRVFTDIVYASPIEASDRFFQELKSILRKAPLIEQDEILIERSEVFLL